LYQKDDVGSLRGGSRSGLKWEELLFLLGNESLSYSLEIVEVGSLRRETRDEAFSYLEVAWGGNESRGGKIVREGRRRAGVFLPDLDWLRGLPGTENTGKKDKKWGNLCGGYSGATIKPKSR